MAYQSSMVADLEYDTKNFPTIIGNDGSVETLDQTQQWIADNLDSLKKELSKSGAILFRGFPVTNAQEYDAFFSAFGYPNFTYKESLSNAVRINYTEYVFSANEAPKDVEIYMHNEMAQTPIYPNIISLFCETTADQGGATSICRSDGIYEKLMQQEPELTKKLEENGIRYTTQMPSEDSPESGQGRSWRGTLSVDNKEQAEQKLGELGYSWTWNSDGSLSAQTDALPAIRTLNDGRKVFFNQIIAAYMGWQGARENPDSVLCFGDGSSIPKHFLESIVDIAYAINYDIEWQNGDVAVVDNHQVMHGRKPYSGETKRKVLVVLGR